MPIISKTNPKGVDNVIDAIQNYIFPILTGEGWDTYNCYPRANKNFKGQFLIPEVSEDPENYIEVLFDDKVKASSFFLVNDIVNFNEDERLIVQNVSLIFQLNLLELFPGVTDHRADEELHVLITKMLTDNQELFVDVLGYETGIRNVYRDLNVIEMNDKTIENDDLGKFHVVKFNFTVTYDLDDCGIMFSPTCSPASISINGVNFVVVSSGASEDIVVKDDAGNVVGAKVGSEWIVPAAGVAGSPFFLWITGQENSFEAGDDGDQFLSGTYNNAILSDFFTLVDDNEWGHKNRFSSRNGGYMDFATGNFFDKDENPTTKSLAFPNDILRDYATRREWFLNRSGSANWPTRVALTQTDVRGGESGWRMPSQAEYFSLANNNDLTTNYIDERLFNWSFVTLFTSTTPKKTTASVYRYNAANNTVATVAKTATQPNAYIKNF